MTKGELLQKLAPFTDELEIEIRMEYQLSDRAHSVNSAHYSLDYKGQGVVVLVGRSRVSYLSKHPVYL